MMTICLLLMSSLTSLFFMVSNTPLMSALMVVFQAVSVSLWIFYGTPTSWMAFILFMVFISAMMIIFVYVSSLASNDFFTFSNYTSVAAFSMLLVMTPTIYLMHYPIPQNTHSNLNLTDLGLTPVYYMQAMRPLYCLNYYISHSMSSYCPYCSRKKFSN